MYASNRPLCSLERAISWRASSIAVAYPTPVAGAHAASNQRTTRRSVCNGKARSGRSYRGPGTLCRQLRLLARLHGRCVAIDQPLFDPNLEAVACSRGVNLGHRQG